jgi:hypothetical protein
VQLLERGHEIGLTRSAMERRGYQHEIDATVESVKRLREAGVRIVIGGDDGLSITPHEAGSGRSSRPAPQAPADPAACFGVR